MNQNIYTEKEKIAEAVGSLNISSLEDLYDKLVSQVRDSELKILVGEAELEKLVQELVEAAKNIARDKYILSYLIQSGMIESKDSIARILEEPIHMPVEWFAVEVFGEEGAKVSRERTRRMLNIGEILSEFFADYLSAIQKTNKKKEEVQ